MSEALAMGTVAQLPVKTKRESVPVQPEVDNHQAGKGRKAVGAINIVSAVTVVSGVAIGNSAGAAFFGWDLAGGNLAGAVAFGCLGLALEVGIISAYLNNVPAWKKLPIHLMSAAAITFGAMHLMDYSVSTTKADSDALKIATAEYTENQKKLSDYASIEKSIVLEKGAIFSIRKKPVKGGTVWSESNECRLNNHPRDCGSIAAHDAKLSELEAQKSEIDSAKLKTRNDDLLTKFPEIRLKQENSSHLSENQPTIDRIRGMVAPSISINDWLLIISTILAVVAQFVTSVVLHPFSPAKSASGSETTRNKIETETATSVKQWLSALLSFPSRIATKKVEAYAIRKAELDHKEEVRREELSRAASDAVLDVGAYLKTLSFSQVKTILDAKNTLKGKEDWQKKVLRTATWMLHLYTENEAFTLSEVVDDIRREKLEAADFLNTTFLSRMMDAMVASGFVINTGSSNRASYAWVDEKAMRQVLKEV